MTICLSVVALGMTTTRSRMLSPSQSKAGFHQYLVEGYTKENGVTVVNFNKSKQIVCEICSLTLKSMKGLKIHKKAKHSDVGTGLKHKIN